MPDNRNKNSRPATRWTGKGLTRIVCPLRTRANVWPGSLPPCPATTTRRSAGAPPPAWGRPAHLPPTHPAGSSANSWQGDVRNDLPVQLVPARLAVGHHTLADHAHREEIADRLDLLAAANAGARRRDPLVGIYLLLLSECASRGLAGACQDPSSRWMMPRPSGRNGADVRCPARESAQTPPVRLSSQKRRGWRRKLRSQREARTVPSQTKVHYSTKSASTGTHCVDGPGARLYSARESDDPEPGLLP